jgi:hypothetical protein
MKYYTPNPRHTFRIPPGISPNWGLQPALHMRFADSRFYDADNGSVVLTKPGFGWVRTNLEIRIERCPQCNDLPFWIPIYQLEEADGFIECDSCGNHLYPEKVHPFVPAR